MDAQHPRQHNSNHRQVIGRIGPIAVGGVAGTQHGRAQARPIRVLIASGRVLWVARLRDALRQHGAVCEIVRSIEEARAALRGTALNPGGEPPASEITARQFGAIISDCALPDGDAMMLAIAAQTHEIPVILAAKRASIDLAVCAMQHGAADLIEHSTPPDAALAARILGLAARSRNLHPDGCDAQRRLFRLHGTPAPHKAHQPHQPPTDGSDLLLAPPFHPEAADHMNTVSTVSEFKGLIRGELDIEALLRTTLEFVLARSGPTNAAVFLPTTSGDYSLGAYVNYDCPKETCDVLLDHLANAVAPRFESVKGMAHLTTQAALDEYLGDDADWLKGSHVVGFPCTHEGECLAIFMLFRDQRSTFAQPLLDQVKTVGELFAAQLARVIHIHHRHLPKNKWGMIGDPPTETDGYDDLAA